MMGRAQSVRKSGRGRRKSALQLLMALGCALVFWIVVFVAADALFPLQAPQEQGRRFAQVVVDARGQPLRAFPDQDGVWRYPVTPEQVSPRYLQALMSYEDRWFYYHPGVNPLALIRAFGQWIYHRETVSGGSTLTMQVARVLHPHSRTLPGKLYQMFRALQLEAHFSKEEILTLYLNYAPFGGAVEGVQAASYTYLGKPAAQLTHAEAALLAVLPQRPSALRPDRFPERARQARDKVIQRMRTFELWTQQETREALQEPVSAFFNPHPMLAPLLARRLSQAFPEQALIQTNIDSAQQTAAQGLVADYIRQFPEQTSAAVLVVDNATLAVRAYVGTAEFGSEERAGHVDMVQAVRSPGSTLKPFLYGMAIDEGLIHSESLLTDAPLAFAGYRPLNFDTGFSGPVGVSEALRRSLNVPAVQVLDALGPELFYARLANAGTPLRLPAGARPNLSLALGGSGATLEELAGAYAALGRQGMAGRLRLQPDDPITERRLLSTGAAWIIQNALRMPLERSNNLYRQSRAWMPKIAYKTGTSFGFRDAWALASTEAVTVAVWVGRPDGTALPHNTGRFSAVPLLDRLLHLMPVESLQPSPQPANVRQAPICWPLGTQQQLQSSDACQQIHHAWLLDEAAPPTLRDPFQSLGESLSVAVSLDASGQYRITPHCTEPKVTQTQVTLWPASLEPWLPRRRQRDKLLPPIHPACGAEADQAIGVLAMEGIRPGSTLTPLPGEGELPEVKLKADGAQGENHWFLDGVWLGSVEPGQEWSLASLTNGPHVVSVMDQAGKTARVAFRVAGVFRK
ncbi:penicillin-binding protein 1C [Hahella sp. NBU794]|uniref:penicillin-binding protein 1C n=1 Tax=Hahella sp. NBU794 TaxID=3422590 RepID=UPI003D6F30C6